MSGSQHLCLEANYVWKPTLSALPVKIKWHFDKVIKTNKKILKKISICNNNNKCTEWWAFSLLGINLKLNSIAAKEDAENEKLNMSSANQITQKKFQEFFYQNNKITFACLIYQLYCLVDLFKKFQEFSTNRENCRKQYFCSTSPPRWSRGVGVGLRPPSLHSSNLFRDDYPS